MPTATAEGPRPRVDVSRGGGRTNFAYAAGELLVQAGRLADARATTESILKHELIDIPECIALLALARVAQHTNDRALASRCEKMARATLEVVTHDYEMQRQLVLLLILQALGRNDDKHLDQTCSLLDAFRADSACRCSAARTAKSHTSSAPR